MQTSQAQASNMFSEPERMHPASGLAKVLAFFSSLLNGPPSLEAKAAARYGGCAWCDSTEQQITHDITRS